jgi:hypothetical protein
MPRKHVPYSILFGPIFHYATTLLQDTAPTEAFAQKCFHTRKPFFTHTHKVLLNTHAFFFAGVLLHTKAF